jgi:hypothetical protein
MKLKKYNDFIKESFGTSQQYANFLTSKAISTDIFNDSLFDVKQFAKVSNFRYLVDTKGHSVNTEVDDNEKYRLLYTCQIQYSLIPGKNDFNKVLDNLNTIKISVDEMIDRVEAEELKLEKNEYWLDKTTGHERVIHTFSISFISDEISTEELKDTFDIYNASQDKEYLDGLKQLRNIYREEGIDFDRYMDTNTDAMGMATDEEYIQVGVFMGDDLYGVASYNTKTKRFIIDENEISDSINAYREDNQ